MVVTWLIPIAPFYAVPCLLFEIHRDKPTYIPGLKKRFLD